MERGVGPANYFTYTEQHLKKKNKKNTAKMTQWDIAWFVCVNVLLVVVAAGMVVCGSYITMETVALSCSEDVDAGASTALAAERSNMATAKCEWTATRQTSGFTSNTRHVDIFPV